MTKRERYDHPTGKKDPDEVMKEILRRQDYRMHLRRMYDENNARFVRQSGLIVVGWICAGLLAYFFLF